MIAIFAHSLGIKFTVVVLAVSDDLLLSLGGRDSRLVILIKLLLLLSTALFANDKRLLWLCIQLREDCMVDILGFRCISSLCLICWDLNIECLLCIIVVIVADLTLVVREVLIVVAQLDQGRLVLETVIILIVIMSAIVQSLSSSVAFVVILSVFMVGSTISLSVVSDLFFLALRTVIGGPENRR